jgi:hypothetical protein
MIRVVDYEPTHLANLSLRACHSGERPASISGSAVTFLMFDEPIAIFGWYFISPGVMQVWALLSDKVTQFKKSFHKQVGLIIEYAFEKWSLRRMQMSVRCDYQAGWKWAKALGFNCEGVMKRYGPAGQDCWLFARIV